MIQHNSIQQTVRQTVRTVTLGEAEITVIRDGEMPVPAADLFQGVDHTIWAGRLPETSDGQIVVPVHAVLVRVDGEAILLDTGMGAEQTDGSHGGRLLPALAGLGLRPDDITRVVISHTHGDHIGGALTWASGAARPVFRRARHHVPRADWEWIRALPAEVRDQYLPLLEALPDLTLDAPEDRLTASLRSVGAAGHTPGHRCLVIESAGAGFCYLGDLVHEPRLHFAEPGRVTGFDAQPEATPPSRRDLAERAVAGDWLLAAAHAAPPLGRLVAAGPQSWTWQAADQ